LTLFEQRESAWMREIAQPSEPWARFRVSDAADPNLSTVGMELEPVA
jgi:hypothetical protein